MEIDADTRAQRVAEFRDVVGGEMDESLCTTLLASNSWNVEATVRQFFEGPQKNPQSIAAFGNDGEEEGHEEGDFLLRQQQRLEEEEEEEEGDSDEFGGKRGDGGVRARRRQVFASSTAGEQQPQLAQIRRTPPANPSSFMSLVKEALCGPQDAIGAASLARKFANEFDRIVGPNTPGPQFFESSFDDALFSATRERRMLCIYLHSPMHPATEQFCKNVVCSRAVLQALSDVRIWGGSVETCDGYVASSKLQCAAFPCLVLLSGAEGGQQATIVDRIYWDSAAEAGEAERIALRISTAREMRGGRNAPLPQQQQQQPQQDSWELQERRRMVQEQDAALQRALEDDRRKLAEKQEQERAEQEERERVEQQVEQERNALLLKQSQILPEPAPSTTEPVATLRFNFPQGQKLSRRFLASDTVGYVRTVLECHVADQNIALQRFALSSNFPKRVYDNDGDTLQQAGLFPQAALFVQDLNA
ncbi:hypothetical protein BASA81_001996 [Batrachochytrium salamandrivorans]|nr:hypothetical protein BASA81_001996 [Batrachochytrium salamandrivorans]